MCGRFVSAAPVEDVAAYFGAELEAGVHVVPSYNVAPTNDVHAVLVAEGRRRLAALRWGLIPPWAPDAKIGNRMINARSETVAESKAYRRPFRARRCIIPADGFYEWVSVPGEQHRQPVYIHRSDGEPLAFAGLWERWQRPDGEPLRSATIITGPANDRIAEVHHRMPIVLPPSAWPQWLDPDCEDAAALGDLLVPAPSKLFTFHPVSREVNNPRRKGAHLIEPLAS
ncbi:MAG: SOS response-associated peptidase [Acidimicrobiia bacterium]|nr:SOS response-associated peptidase [Acidimicrobiia bacterium]MYE67485.1 SOS response-associated peptidase [Acidimicrobiia bacterium]